MPIVRRFETQGHHKRWVGLGDESEMSLVSVLLSVSTNYKPRG